SAFSGEEDAVMSAPAVVTRVYDDGDCEVRSDAVLYEQTVASRNLERIDDTLSGHRADAIVRDEIDDRYFGSGDEGLDDEEEFEAGPEADEPTGVYYVSVPVPNGMKLESVNLTFA